MIPYRRCDPPSSTIKIEAPLAMILMEDKTQTPQTLLDLPTPAWTIIINELTKYQPSDQHNNNQWKLFQFLHEEKDRSNINDATKRHANEYYYMSLNDDEITTATKKQKEEAKRYPTVYKSANGKKYCKIRDHGIVTKKRKCKGSVAFDIMQLWKNVPKKVCIAGDKIKSEKFIEAIPNHILQLKIGTRDLKRNILYALKGKEITALKIIVDPYTNDFLYPIIMNLNRNKEYLKLNKLKLKDVNMTSIYHIQKQVKKHATTITIPTTELSMVCKRHFMKARNEADFYKDLQHCFEKISACLNNNFCHTKKINVELLIANIPNETDMDTLKRKAEIDSWFEDIYLTIKGRIQITFTAKRTQKPEEKITKQIREELALELIFKTSPFY